MKKRGLLAFFLMVIMAASLGLLAACGQSSGSAQSKDSMDVQSEPEMSEEPIVLETEPFYVLVVGSDSREGTIAKKGQYADGKGRSDTIVLVRVDPTNYKLTFVSVPRDTTIELDGQSQKINESFHQGGIEALKKEIKKLTGVNPDHYLITTFVNFQKIIDEMGGIKVNVPIYESMQDIVSGEMIEFDAGEQTLNGAQALVFARDRHSYDWSGNADPYRQTNDRYLLRTMIEQILAHPKTAGDMAFALYPFIETDFSDRELAAYVEDFAEHAKELSTESYTGPYAGEFDVETELWLAYREEEVWRQVMEAIENGEDASEIVPVMTALDFGSDDEGDNEAE